MVVLFYTALAANIFGSGRKIQKVDKIISRFTGRDWYPTVSFRFFRTNLNSPVIVQVCEEKYIGTLSGAPDSADDNYVILTDVFLLPEVELGAEPKPPEPLPLIDHLLIKVDDISQIQAASKEILVKPEATPNKSRRRWTDRLKNWAKPPENTNEGIKS